MALYATLSKAEKPAKVVLDVMKTSGDPKLSDKEAKIFGALKDLVKKVDDTTMEVGKFKKQFKTLPNSLESVADKAEALGFTIGDYSDEFRKLSQEIRNGKIKLPQACKQLAEAQKKCVAEFKTYNGSLKKATVEAVKLQKTDSMLVHMKTAINRWTAGIPVHIDMFLKELGAWKPKKLDKKSLNMLTANSKTLKGAFATLKKQAK